MYYVHANHCLLVGRHPAICLATQGQPLSLSIMLGLSNYTWTAAWTYDEKGVEAEELEEVEVVLGDLVHLYDQEAQPDHQHHQEEEVDRPVQHHLVLTKKVS